MKFWIKIKACILLIGFLSVCFPIQELFHEHHFEQECINKHEKDKKECNHDVHFSVKHDQGFCFFVHISKSFFEFEFKIPDFNFTSFDSLHILAVQKTFISKLFTSYLLRGPPSII